MNNWTEKSMTLTYSDGYLDKILEIYPIRSNPNREIPFEDEIQIREAYNENDHMKLISLLNRVVKVNKLKFPIECSYTKCLREEPLWFENNPNVIQEIGNLLLNININKLIKNCIVPIKSSRQLGNAFNEWFSGKFSTISSIEILGASREEKKRNAEELIGYNGNEKNIDVFVKINGIYLIGETKFITSSGGTQGKSFSEALKISERYSRQAGVIPLSIIDGYCWRRSGEKMYQSIEASDESQIIISALLLDELFFKISENATFVGEDVENERLINYF